MQKSKVLLIVLTIVVLATTSFQGIGMAAQVTGINESKGRIHINGSVNDGFIPGATVCFLISSASYGDEFVCGTVQSASGSKAVVKIPKSRAKKMKIGTEAMLKVEEEAKEEIKDIALMAKVTGIDESEGNIYIDGGMDTGFVLEATVCFAISSDKEPVCGTVQKAEASKAVIKVPKKEAGKIQIGTGAMLKVEEKAKENINEKEDWFR